MANSASVLRIPPIEHAIDVDKLYLEAIVPRRLPSAPITQQYKMKR